MNLQMLKRILWQWSGGYYLFWITFIYFWIGMYSVFVEQFWPLEYIQAVWILICSLPLWVPPLARKLNMKLFWEL